MVFTGQCIAQRFAVLLGRGTQWEILKIDGILGDSRYVE